MSTSRSIYLVERQDNARLGEYQRFVVAAWSVAEARNTDPVRRRRDLKVTRVGTHHRGPSPSASEAAR